jgi:hypothetical protein
MESPFSDSVVAHTDAQAAPVANGYAPEIKGAAQELGFGDHNEGRTPSLPEESRAPAASDDPMMLASIEDIPIKNPLLDDDRTHHLLRHSLPNELRGNSVLSHFGAESISEAARMIKKMSQRELQAKFRTVYNARTFSNNNNWLRRKLFEAIGLDPGKGTTKKPAQAAGQRRRRVSRLTSQVRTTRTSRGARGGAGGGGLLEAENEQIAEALLALGGLAEDEELSDAEVPRDDDDYYPPGGGAMQAVVPNKGGRRQQYDVEEDNDDEERQYEIVPPAAQLINTGVDGLTNNPWQHHQQQQQQQQQYHHQQVATVQAAAAGAAAPKMDAAYAAQNMAQMYQWMARMSQPQAAAAAGEEGGMPAQAAYMGAPMMQMALAHPHFALMVQAMNNPATAAALAQAQQQQQQQAQHVQLQQMNPEAYQRLLENMAAANPYAAMLQKMAAPSVMAGMPAAPPLFTAKGSFDA